MFDRATVFAGQTNVLIILLGSIAITACGSMFIFVRQTAGLVGQIGPGNALERFSVAY